MHTAHKAMKNEKYGRNGASKQCELFFKPRIINKSLVTAVEAKLKNMLRHNGILT
jgi:hypothetical protein